MSDCLDKIAAVSGGRVGRRKIWALVTGASIVGALLWFVPSRSVVPRFAPPVAITKYSGIEQQPAFSPDGSRIAFVWSGRDGNQDDVYIRSSGGDQRHSAPADG